MSMGASRCFPPKHSSASTITSVEKKCTCCMLHPIGSESSPWFASSPSSTSESHPISHLVSDLIRVGVTDPPKISFQVQSSPKNTDSKKKWDDWVKVMSCEKKFSAMWQKAGINDAIVVASVASDIRIDQQMMEALIGFWCSLTNTFVFPWGEAGLSPEDSHVLTSLPIWGADLNRLLTTEEDDLKNRLIVETEKILMLNAAAKCTGTITHDIWLNWFVSERDIDDELRHLGFLTYWLCKDVFSSAKPTLGAIFGLAARLSLGDRIALGPAIVANIYHDLNVITESTVSNQWKKDKGRGVRVKAFAPFGILQCWVWERFESLRPNMHGPILQQSRVRISRWTGSYRKTGYNKAMEIFHDERSFTWRPYSYRLNNWMEPKWYNMESRVITVETGKTHAYVYDFLALVSCTFVNGLSSDGDIISEGYNPNRFARQFGFDQAVPLRSETCRGFNYNDDSTVGVQVCIPGITRHGNPSKDYIQWLKKNTKNYGQTLREHFMPKAAMEISDLEVRKNWMEGNKCKVPLGERENNNTNKKRKSDEISIRPSVINEEEDRNTLACSLTGSSYPFHKNSMHGNIVQSVEDTGNAAVPNVRISDEKECYIINIDNIVQSVEDTGNAAVPSVRISDEKECYIINIDSDEEDNQMVYDDKENVVEKSENALVEELEEFQRLGLMDYQKVNPELEESKKILFVNCSEDPYGQEAIDCYPNFFRLIPQRPHYKGVLEGGNIAEEMRPHILLGQWYMLVSLMNEVLRTNVQTNAVDFERMFRKARMLEKNGFEVRHLIARLKLVQRSTLEKLMH